MPRIFACLVTGQLIVLLAAAVFGLLRAQESVEQHIVLAVFALLLSCLIQVTAFTYLTITGKMIAQAVHLGPLSSDSIHEAAGLKRSMTRAVAAMVLTMVLVTATGAYQWREGGSLPFHFPAACLAFAVHVGAGSFQFTLVARNASLLRSVLTEYSGRRSGSPRSTSGVTPEGRRSTA